MEHYGHWTGKANDDKINCLVELGRQDMAMSTEMNILGKIRVFTKEVVFLV